MNCQTKTANIYDEWNWVIDDSTVIAVGVSKLGNALVRTADGREYTIPNTETVTKVTDMIERRNAMYRIKLNKEYANTLKK